MVCLKSSGFRIEELEKDLFKTELYLRSFVKDFQSMNDTIVKSHVGYLLKDRLKLETEVSGLSKYMKNLIAIKMSMEKKNAEEKHKIANRNFVTINKLKEENSKLRKYIADDSV
ncbi:hypothetical protein INT48_009649 [Thamnidium elegans]|uniref:Uncharacterized protein n=1 Tax=Thamnidium elegans TaxID=101142 RepID=A0A8H7VX60_9FUNG|nr:hypothetical protein INT48_009649 [Thamnidium elegans]